MLKNIKFTDKARQLEETKINKNGHKGLAIGLALALALTPVADKVLPINSAARAETTTTTEQQTETQGFSLKTQSQESDGSLEEQETVAEPMTFDQYAAGVEEGFKYLSKFNEFYYEHMQQDLQSAYHHINYEYIDEDLTAQLMDLDVISNDEMVGPDGKLTPSSQWLNIQNCNSLFNEINNYNETHIRLAYERYTKKGITDVSFADYVMPELINPSILCFDEHDREDIDQLFRKYVAGYNLEKGSLHTNENFLQAYRQITQVGDNESDLFDSSIGVRWMQLKTIGNEMRQFLRDFMWINYEDDLHTYFKEDSLSRTQLFLKDGLTVQFPDNELEEAVKYFGILEEFCEKKVNKDFFSQLRNDELARKEQAQEEVGKGK